MQNNFVRLFCDSCLISLYSFKKLSKLVNFCVAILILKMKETKEYSSHIMLNYFKKGKNTTEKELKRALYSVWRRCSDWSNVPEVVCRVSCWRFLVDGAPWLGRPVEVDSEQIETLAESSQRYTTCEAAGTLRTSRSSPERVAPACLCSLLWCLGSTQVKRKKPSWSFFHMQFCTEM